MVDAVAMPGWTALMEGESNVHPVSEETALAPESRAALTLRTVCGLSTAEVARAQRLGQQAAAVARLDRHMGGQVALGNLAHDFAGHMWLATQRHGDAAHIDLDVPLVGLVATAGDGRCALLQTADDLHSGHADLLVVEGDIGADARRGERKAREAPTDHA